MKFFALFFTISTLLFAELEISFPEDEEVVDYKSIVAFEFGLGSLSRPKVNTLSGNADIKRDFTNLGFKLGAEDIGLRLFLSYRPIILQDATAQSFGIELDSMIDLSSKMKFFYGLAVGGLLYEIVDNNETSTYKTSWNNYYGFGTGLVFEISKQFEIEFSGRYSITNINDDSVDSSYVFDQFMNYYVGLNYKF
jgi:hypothetical protein